MGTCSVIGLFNTETGEQRDITENIRAAVPIEATYQVQVFIDGQKLATYERSSEDGESRRVSLSTDFGETFTRLTDPQTTSHEVVYECSVFNQDLG